MINENKENWLGVIFICVNFDIYRYISIWAWLKERGWIGEIHHKAWSGENHGEAADISGAVAGEARNQAGAGNQEREDVLFVCRSGNFEAVRRGQNFIIWWKIVYYFFIYFYLFL